VEVVVGVRTRAALVLVSVVSAVVVVRRRSSLIAF
jgi:hypothetical protein